MTALSSAEKAEIARADDADTLLATATGHAARALELVAAEQGDYLLERDLRIALTAALEAQGAQVFHESRYQLPHWQPQPGGVDISVPLATVGMALVELNWANENNVFEALWDAAKLADAMQLREVANTYLCYGASDVRWKKPVECAEIFDTGSCEIVALIRQHEDWWERYILAHSSGRPTAVPERLEVRRISDVSLNIEGQPWRLRTIRLLPAGSRREFVDGRPTAAA